MHDFIMPLYIISGIGMAIGVYLTIRYRPYCTLKSPEREIAMELYRKKLMNEPMREAEIEKYELYQYETEMYTLWHLRLLVPVLIHILIFAHNQWYDISYLYYISMVATITIVAEYKAGPILVFCTRGRSLDYDTEIQDDYSLKNILIYQKKANKEKFSDNESILYKNEQSTYYTFLFFDNIVKFGIVLHLLLDVWFGLNGSLIIK